ncbi:hypothetical protein I6A84_25455 [Frankia sp. CNm7]|uniref:Luciferase-like domain-containing protein n=1 Tax=Frankia nepalensis TaxID=1836974 RepID=A0A937RLC8_9ACTN|nr:hypothetical protein [Frankia nepalensis]MBL7516383.1 hypothetical protein [Frankia nepalensis]MBL7521340.1 hypothetical protein [Frankia nepalensis]MBL7632457.1 hypothetical protein [Frankia nepalensis]
MSSTASSPRLHTAATAPRVIAGLPVAAHDDLAQARAAAAASAVSYGEMPNYQRVLALGGVKDAAGAAIVGSEATVATQLQGLLDAGATDIWAAVFPVGDTRETRSGSIGHLTELLRELVG